MSHGDDDDSGGDDSQLQSLRAVWLAMPDEDPPERGLDALLAAARTKAVEMAADAEPEAEPTWWQRFASLLRRPPVLAIASVVVILAGALLVGNRSMKASAPSNSAAPSREDVPTERHEREQMREAVPPPPHEADDRVSTAPHELLRDEAVGGALAKQADCSNARSDAGVGGDCAGEKAAAGLKASTTAEPAN